MPRNVTRGSKIYRAKRPKEDRADVELVRPCVLSIDPGNDAGWAIHVPKGLLSFGELHLDKDAVQVQKIIGQFLDICGKLKVHPVVSLENVSWGRQNTGAPVGIWRYMARSLGVPKSRLISLHTKTWRKYMFGTGGLSKEEAKAKALETVFQMYGVHDITHNTAEAILMGYVVQRNV